MEVYNKLEETILSSSIDLLTSSIEIRRGILSSIMIDDQYYFYSSIIKKLPLPIVMTLARAELDLATQCNYLAALREEHFSVPPVDMSTKTVGEKYRPTKRVSQGRDRQVRAS
jgi:hypothetical protein